MNQLTPWLQDFYVVLIVLGWVGAFIFPLMYAVTTNFWRTEMGMHFFSYGLAVWLALTPGFVFVTFGDFPGRGFLNLITFALTVFVIWWRAILFVKIYLSARRTKEKIIDSEH